MRHIDTDTTPSLLFRLRDSTDAEAWQEFVKVYSPLIYGFCRKRKVQSQDAADVTQEVLLRVNRAMQDFQYAKERGLFRDWLARVVKNELSRFWSRQGRMVELEATAETTSNALWQEHFHHHIMTTALSRSQPHFEADTWEIFLSAWEGKLSAAKVAEEHNVPIEQVYVAKSRVLKRLRREVNVLAEDSP